MISDQALDGSLQENAYVVSSGSDCIIIHPGFDPTVQKKGSAGKTPILGEFNDLYEYLATENLTPEAILLTHSHPDHTLGVKPLVERFGIPVYSGTTDPGHGPSSTIARERMSNPFLEPFNEREEMDLD